MAFDASEITGQIGALLGSAEEALGMNPIIAGVTVLALLVLLPRIVRRKKDAADYSDPVAARGAARSGRSRGPSPLDERFAALRVDSEDPEAVPRIRRHFSGHAKSGEQHQLRRRRAGGAI